MSQSDNKIGMSLDEIIRMEKTEKGSKPAIRGRRSRGGRLVASRRKRVPVGRAIGGRKSRGLRRIASTTAATTGGTSLRGPRSLGQRRNLPNSAMAILQRARETAAAAAQAAEEAAALIEQSRDRRRDYVDELRGAIPREVETSARAPAFKRRQRRRRRGSALERGMGSTRTRNAPRSSLKRPGGYQPRYAELSYSTASSYASPRPRLPAAEFDPARYVPVSDEYLEPVDYVGNEWPATYNIVDSYGNDAYEPYTSGGSRWRDRSRNAEYLAQARALIRAQNEQWRQNPAPSRPPTRPRRRRQRAVPLGLAARNGYQGPPSYW